MIKCRLAHYSIVVDGTTATYGLQRNNSPQPHVFHSHFVNEDGQYIFFAIDNSLLVRRMRLYHSGKSIVFFFSFVSRHSQHTSERVQHKAVTGLCAIVSGIQRNV